MVLAVSAPQTASPAILLVLDTVTLLDVLRATLDLEWIPVVSVSWVALIVFPLMSATACPAVLEPMLPAPVSVCCAQLDALPALMHLLVTVVSLGISFLETHV